MKIYESIVISFGIMLAGQYARYAVYPFMPREDNTVAPYPVEKPLSMIAALDTRPSCEGDARQPMFTPCGFDAPVPTIKPRG